MSKYSKAIAAMRSNVTQRETLVAKVDELIAKLKDDNAQYQVFLDAQALLSTVTTENTRAVLNYITGIINKALAEIFPHDGSSITLISSLTAAQKAQIEVVLKTKDGKQRDLVYQTGNGLRQVISFLFVVSLVELHKGTRVMLMDELLSGLTTEAKAIIGEIIKIFADEGFQFILVEHGWNDVGTVWLVEPTGDKSEVTRVDGEYDNESFMFHPPYMASQAEMTSSVGFDASFED